MTFLLFDRALKYFRLLQQVKVAKERLIVDLSRTLHPNMCVWGGGGDLGCHPLVAVHVSPLKLCSFKFHASVFNLWPINTLISSGFIGGVHRGVHLCWHWSTGVQGGGGGAKINKFYF